MAGRLLAVTAACAMLTSTASVQAQAPVKRGVASLIESAVRAAVNDARDVRITVSSVSIADGVSPDGAAIAPGARFARPARFSLLDGDRTVGYAVASVTASLPQLRAARPVRAGDTIEAADVVAATAETVDRPMEDLPGTARVVGARAARDIRVGEVIVSTLVRQVPLVQSGAHVVIRAMVDGVEATGTAVALQSGSAGDVIRVVNPRSRRQLRGRVIGANEVEVMHAS